MKKFKITSLTTGNKTATDAAGNSYFIPESFRKTIVVGQYALAIEKPFKNGYLRDENNELILDANKKPQSDGQPFTRIQVSVVGTLADVTLAANEDMLIEAEGKAVLAAEMAKWTTGAVSTEQLKALEGAI